MDPRGNTIKKQHGIKAGVGMRRFATVSMALIVISLCAALPALAENNTCTNRQDVCFAYCERNYQNAPKCQETCRQLLAECLSNGCWDSRITAKRCGLIKH
jgi:hypothetical protein